MRLSGGRTAPGLAAGRAAECWRVAVETRTPTHSAWRRLMPARLFRAGADLPDEQLARIYRVRLERLRTAVASSLPNPPGLGEASYWS